MQGWICKCEKCGRQTITTNEILDELMVCGCGGILKPESECNIGIDLAMACNDVTTTIPIVKHGDTIVVRPMRHIKKEECEKYVKEMTNSLNEKVAMLTPTFEIVGVIKNG